VVEAAHQQAATRQSESMTLVFCAGVAVGVVLAFVVSVLALWIAGGKDILR